MALRRWALFCVMAIMTSPASATVGVERVPGTAEPRLCLAAADRAAAQHGVPRQMMRAITLVETRRSVGGTTGPWPWTLNIGGEGFWHASRAEALAHAEREMEQGKRSIDLGCFQLNYRWHGENFSGPDAMLDPDLAGDYAARFLAGLHAETGDWMRAAGLYHSRNPVHASRYRGLVRRALTRIGTSPEAFAALDPPVSLAGTPPRRGQRARGAGGTEIRNGARTRPGADAAAAPRRSAGRGAIAPDLALTADRSATRSPARSSSRPSAWSGAVSAGAVALSLFDGHTGPPLLPASQRPRAARSSVPR